MSLRPPVLLLALVTAAACSSSERRAPADSPDRRLTRAECTAAVDHAIALLDADPAAAPFAADMRAHRDARIAECLATATLADHHCLMASRTLEELGLCPPPGQVGREPAATPAAGGRP